MNTFTVSPSLNAVLARCHAVITQNAQEGPAQPEPRKPTPAEVQTLTAAFQQAQEPVLPQVVTVDRLSRYATADAVAVAAGATGSLSRGAARLWSLLHGVAVRWAAQKGYSAAVTQVVFSLPQGAVAALLGYTDRHVRRLQTELEQAGLLDTGAHAVTVAGEVRWATMLWAVKVSTGNTAPKLRPDEYVAQWRNLGADFKTGNTVQALYRRMSGGIQMPKDSNEVAQAFQMAVTGVLDIRPVTLSFVRTIRLGIVQDAVDALGMLADSSPGSERRRLVQQLAGWLADSLNDQHSFRWWCQQLWRVAGEWEKVGALQAQLGRLLTDLTEWDGVLNPAAWFARRVTTSN